MNKGYARIVTLEWQIPEELFEHISGHGSWVKAVRGVWYSKLELGQCRNRVRELYIDLQQAFRHPHTGATTHN